MIFRWTVFMRQETTNRDAITFLLKKYYLKNTTYTYIEIYIYYLLRLLYWDRTSKLNIWNSLSQSFVASP